MKLSELRREYSGQELKETDCPENPLDLFKKWFSEALFAEVLDANAMTLSTLNQRHGLRARTVLLKDYSLSGFTFYTNYQSQKGQDLDQDARASLLFFWKEISRQVQICGRCIKTDRRTSEAYFASRPADSRLSALCSPQSKRISNRKELETLRNDVRKSYPSGDYPCPEHWGGYLLVPEYLEFWQGRPGRLHDRIAYEKQQQGWEKFRLAP